MSFTNKWFVWIVLSKWKMETQPCFIWRIEHDTIASVCLLSYLKCKLIYLYYYFVNAQLTRIQICLLLHCSVLTLARSADVLLWGTISLVQCNLFPLNKAPKFVTTHINVLLQLVKMWCLYGKKKKCIVTVKVTKQKLKFSFALQLINLCFTSDPTRCGVVVCKTSTSSFYPVGFYSNQKGLCSFENVLPVQSLSTAYKEILNIIEHSKCGAFHLPPLCRGHRCRLGDCLSDDKICNGKFDCHDGSDEDEKMCLTRRDKSKYINLILITKKILNWILLCSL